MHLSLRGRLSTRLLRSHVDKIMRRKGDESVANTYRGSCQVDSQLLIATVLPAWRVSVWHMARLKIATLNLVRRSPRKGNYNSRRRWGRNCGGGCGEEEEGNWKEDKRQNKRSHTERISGCKDIYTKTMHLLFLSSICSELYTCGLMLPERGWKWGDGGEMERRRELLPV